MNQLSSEKPSAIIFGGNGFIGTHLCDNLLSRGFDVTVADIRLSSRIDVGQIQCDMRDKIEIELNRPPDLIFHLAAVHRTPGHEDSEYFETNIGSALNLVEWSNKVGAKTIIYTSSISVYGAGPEKKDELSPLRPNSAYGKSKKYSEEILRQWQKSLPTERTLIISRPAIIFGSGENGNFTRLARALKYRYFIIPGNRNVIKACGYVKDLVSSFTFMTENFRCETISYNFSFPASYSLYDICKAFNKIANYPLPKTFPMKLISKLLEYFPGSLSKIGLRVKKLQINTNIEPKVLSDLAFPWSTNLETALKDWKENTSELKSFK